MSGRPAPDRGGALHLLPGAVAAFRAQFTVWLMCGLALTQGVLIAAIGVTPARRATGVALTILLLLETWKPWLLGSHRLRTATLLSAGIGANFAAHLIQSPAPFHVRPVQATVAIGYMALLVSASLAPLSGAVRRPTRLLVGVAALALAAAEVLLESRPADFVDGRIEWQGAVLPDSQTGDRYPSGAVLRTRYPDDPRDYFDDVEARSRSWELAVHAEGSRARLEFPLERGRQMRVLIERVSDSTWWGIQLNQAPLPFERDRFYTIAFQARASRPRAISVAVSEGHAPWSGLGYSREVRLDTAWTRVEDRFEVDRSDSIGRLHFDLGRDSGDIDLADVTVRRGDGRALEVVPSASPGVSYRINALGCRGPDLSDAERRSRHRVLVLGDSYALGVGVHEQDTFAAHLASVSAAYSNGSVGTMVVLNCGAAGHGPREAQFAYRRISPTLDPDVVLFVAGHPRERTWLEEQRASQHALLKRLSYLFRSGRLLKASCVRDDSVSAVFVTDATALAKEIARSGRRIGVVLFDQPGCSPWAGTAATVARELAGQRVPALDLGPALGGVASDWRDASVHPVFDSRPGPAAHAAAAEAIAVFLRREALLAPRVMPETP